MPVSVFQGYAYRFMSFMEDLNAGPQAYCSEHFSCGAAYLVSLPYVLKQDPCVDLELADLDRLT